MAVYSISYDIDNFPILEETGLELSMQATTGDLLDLHGAPRSETWEPLELQWVYDDQDKANGLPDIALWRAGQYACSERALQLIKDVVGDSCEFLPVRVDGESWYAIHVLTTIDAIDRKLTIFNYRKNGEINRTRRFQKLVLRSEVSSGYGLFHVKDAGLHTYCNDAFYEAVGTGDLTGLTFNERQVS